MRPRRVAIALAALLVTATGVGVAVEHVGASAIVYAPNAGHPPDPAADPPPPDFAPAPYAPDTRKIVPMTTRAIRVDVGPPAASLSVVVASAPEIRPPPGTVFLLHGIRDRKESMLGWGRTLAHQGYTVVLVDARGQGRSSGNFLTYGVVEARDLSQVLDALDAQGLITGRVGVMGVSYGAATALQWAAREPRIAAVVAVAPFASLRRVVPGYARNLIPLVGGLVPDFLIDRAIARAGRTASFDADEASPLAAVSRTKARVLLVHGDADEHIPASESRAICKQAPDHCQVVFLPGETHDSITADRSGALWRDAEGWIRTFVGPDPPPPAPPPPAEPPPPVIPSKPPG